ncbi:MAG: COX15/CtaA family protein [Acidimicrobiales bacterium]
MSAPFGRRDGARKRTRTDSVVYRIRALSVVVLVATYCLIVLGSTVRVTNSGMGCIGWPLCSGQVGPIDQFHPLMEQSHRFLASLVAALVVALVVATWRGGSRVSQVRIPAAVSAGVLVVQIVLGAITVFAHNAPVTVALHLVVGLLFLAVVTITVVASFVSPHQHWSLAHQTSRLAWAAVTGLFLVFISGALVVDGGAQSACESWPLCGASSAPRDLVMLQIIHRSMVACGALLVVVYLLEQLVKQGTPHSQRVLASGGVTLLAAQVVVGAFDAWLGAPIVLADLHLALAAALWAVVIAHVALLAREEDHIRAPVIDAVLRR